MQKPIMGVLIAGLLLAFSTGCASLTGYKVTPATAEFDRLDQDDVGNRGYVGGEEIPYWAEPPPSKTRKLVGFEVKRVRRTGPVQWVKDADQWVKDNLW